MNPLKVGEFAIRKGRLVARVTSPTPGVKYPRYRWQVRYVCESWIATESEGTALTLENAEAAALDELHRLLRRYSKADA